MKRESKWEYKNARMSKRVRQRDKATILRAYEEAMSKGRDREDILERLSRKYHKSERQIERYIQQAKKERGDREDGQVSQVVVTEDKHRALMVHFEAIRNVIKIWLEKQHPPSVEELADAWKGNLTGWGITAQVLSDGSGSAAPVMGQHPLYDSFRYHLVPPLVKEDFWGKVDELVGLGLGFLSGAVDIHRELSKVAEERSGFGIIAGSWQNEPVTGITRDFIQMLYEDTLDIIDFSRWTHSVWAALWPENGGLIVTWPNEGLRLLRHLGLDPVIQQTFWPLNGGPFILPRHQGERIAYGDADLYSTGKVALLLCFGPRVIAVASLPEQLTSVQEAHEGIVADCASWQMVGSLARTRERLDTLSQEVRSTLEFAHCETSFPGRCPQCPEK
ncbi:MAG: hypothetical protein ACLFVA_05590 [Dehalococcoidia bacterium]